MRQTIIYRHTSGHSNPHQGGCVRRSRTFSVPEARKITKPQVLSAAARPPDETIPKAARLTAAYNLQSFRFRKATSADDRCPSPQRKVATTMCRRHTSCGEAVFHSALRYFMCRRHTSFFHSPCETTFFTFIAPLSRLTSPTPRKTSSGE